MEAHHRHVNELSRCEKKSKVTGAMHPGTTCPGNQNGLNNNPKSVFKHESGKKCSMCLY